MTPKPTGGCTPTPEPGWKPGEAGYVVSKDELDSILQGLANWGHRWEKADTTTYIYGTGGVKDMVTSKQQIKSLIRTEVLKARIEGQIAAKQNMLNYNMVVKDAESAVEDSIAELTAQLQANQKEELK